MAPETFREGSKCSPGLAARSLMSHGFVIHFPFNTAIDDGGFRSPVSVQ